MRIISNADYKELVNEAYHIIDNSDAGRFTDNSQILMSPAFAVLLESLIKDNQNSSHPRQLNG